MRAAGWGAAIGIAIIAVLIAPVGAALARLDAARAELAALPARAPRNAPLPAGMAVDSADALAIRLRRQAARDGVLVETLAVARDGDAALARLRVSGSADAVLHFADAVERGRPLVRFAAWRIEPAGGAIRLQGEAVAPWR